MRCSRCREEFSSEELRPPSALLRVLAWPYLYLMHSRVAQGEMNASYCKTCRRQMNVCLLFLGFLVLLFGIVLIVQSIIR